MMKTGFLSADELADVGFGACGDNVLVSRNAAIYGAERISLGNHVRIDDFCVLSAGAGGIRIGNRVHVASSAAMFGAAPIEIGDFCNLSGRVSIYSSSDDYSGRTMTSPMIPAQFKDVDSRPVALARHVIVGCGAVILPGSTLEEGCAVGALSLVRGDWEPFTVLSGVPAIARGERSRDLLALEAKFVAENGL